MPTLTSGQGRPLHLGERLGQGGEGAVYRTSGQLALKLYNEPPDLEQQRKLRAMTDLGREYPELTEVSTWPVDVALEAGQVRGVLMPLVYGALPLHELTTPVSRRRLFPGADLEFMLSVAASLAGIVTIMHLTGQVIGDFNPNNVLVGRNAQVTLVDVDSFHITAGGKVYPCRVGMPEYLPPERQGAKLGRFTPADDVFALLVHVFMLLYGGWHPFSGRWDAKDPPTLGEAIGRRAFPYSRNPRKDVRVPPGNNDLSVLPEQLANLFDRTFSGTYRPTAEHVRQALDEAHGQLTTEGCSHPHFRGCPCGTCLHAEMRKGAVEITVPGSPGWAIQALESLGPLLTRLPQVRVYPEPEPEPPRPFAAALLRLYGRVSDAQRLAVVAVLLLLAALASRGMLDVLLNPGQLLLLILAALLIGGLALAWPLLTRQNGGVRTQRLMRATRELNSLHKDRAALETVVRRHAKAAATLKKTTPEAARNRLDPKRAAAMRALHAEATETREDLERLVQVYAEHLAVLERFSRKNGTA